MQRTAYTIGHSNHTQEHFLHLLTLHGITAVCDVRSKPYSRFNPQFNHDILKKILPEKGIAYLFLGKELGARSEDRACYQDGRVQYALMAKTELFQQGLARVQGGIGKGFRVSLMCAEKDPIECHRTVLVARHLTMLGVAVIHILADGEVESHADALRRLALAVHVPENDLFLSTEELQAEAYLRQEERIAHELDEASLQSSAG